MLRFKRAWRSTSTLAEVLSVQTESRRGRPFDVRVPHSGPTLS